MVTRRIAVLLAVAALLGCDGGEAARAALAGADGGGAARAEADGPPTRGPAGAVIPDSAFGALVGRLSEPGGYFDTDNLISNEASYLHVIGELEARDLTGGVYVGVGPAQNFSYMAVVRPALAFVLDIRRDNLLQHLWYKALFERSDTRLDYLCLMVARACGGASDSLGVAALVRRVEGAAPVDTAEALIGHVIEHASSTGVALDPDDKAAIRSIHRRFAAAGLGLRFNSHGRAPRSDYPTLRHLLLERDRSGRQANYLASESGYRYLRALQQANRVVPVVGDLAGDHAVRAIGEEAARRGRAVTAFYTSNVEFYLFGDGVFPRWIANLETLPVADGAVIIRSYFNRFRAIPGAVPGYASTQLVQPIGALLADWEEGRIGSYRALVVQ